MIEFDDFPIKYMIIYDIRKGPFVYNCLYAKFKLFPSSKFSRPTCRIAFARERLPKGGHPLGRNFEVASTMRHAEIQNRSGLISLYFFEKTEELVEIHGILMYFA